MSQAVSNAGESAGVRADVYAAGAVCWRERGGVLEVLLVHRPKYNDWSWPKGKVEPGETLPETAVREVAEETGYRIHLGIPLPAARYTVGKRLDKHVSYWAAQVKSDASPAPENPKEIDEAAWCPAQTALSRLSAHADREQLTRLMQAHATGSLFTWPFILVRHGKAFPRAKWHETESVRPLLGLGTVQAMALTGLLSAWKIKRVYSSPWKRCVATVKPIAAALGKNVRLLAPLSEKAHTLAPQKTVKTIEKLLLKEQPAVVCTHRPVLPSILHVLGEHAPAGVRAELPQEDPYLHPGEVLIAHVRRGPVPRIVALERFRPIDG